LRSLHRAGVNKIAGRADGNLFTAGNRAFIGQGAQAVELRYVSCAINRTRIFYSASG